MILSTEGKICSLSKIYQKQVQFWLIILQSSMISLTIIPDQTNTFQQKSQRNRQPSAHYPRVRFNSLKEISNIKVTSSKIVPLQFTTQQSTIKPHFQQNLANPWDLPFKIDQISRQFDDSKRKQQLNIDSQYISNLKQKQKKPLFENIDEELEKFKVATSPLEEDYLRTHYEKLALQSYIETIKNTTKKGTPIKKREDDKFD